MVALRNIPNLLEKLDQIFANLLYKSIKNNMLSLIARPSCGRFIYPKQTNTTTWRLACLPYTKSLPNSKTNLLYPEKALNGAVGSYTPSWRSWCPLLHRKHPIYFDVLIRFSEMLVSTRSAFTLSWLHPKFPGNDCGEGFGK